MSKMAANLDAIADVNGQPSFSLGDGFLLRPFVILDSEKYLFYKSEPAMNFFTADDERVCSLIQGRKNIANYIKLLSYDVGIYWAIARELDDQIIGACGLLYNLPKTGAEIGYELSKPYWNKGITSKAVSKVIQYGFIKKKLCFIKAATHPCNRGSLKILYRYGFYESSRLPKYQILGGKYCDYILLLLSREIYFNKNKL